ncbi:thymidylate kinase [Agrilus planipennis]|uniref:Thymidylate kinase n=1 Tax=Agrilus planipennis TaxID=224129 RepID=A0A1W4XS65_AGRPL|nr:thymidylate kinase [Agrilus planipennis]
MSRGAFIILEGIDRTGKSTQSAKLIESLRKLNINAERMAFPNRTSNTGQLISKYLSNKDYHINDQTIHLLFSANRWENLDFIRSKLFAGTSIIVDRYSYSGVAYSVAKGLDFMWCLQPEVGLPQPDLVFLLDINPEDSRLRSGFGSERYENLQMQKNVSTILRQFAEIENYWKIVDASKSIEDVHEILLKHSNEIINDIQIDKRPLTSITSTAIKRTYPITLV